MLVQAQPEKPFSNPPTSPDGQTALAADTWFLQVSKSFYDSKSPALDAADSLVREKFYSEGSYATLLYCWVADTEKKLYYLGTGDTSLFLFRPSGDDYALEIVFPIDTQQSLNAPPRLLNWRRQADMDWTIRETSLQDGDRLVICTDAMARWLLVELLFLGTEGLRDLLHPDLLAGMEQMLERQGTVATATDPERRETVAAPAEPERTTTREWLTTLEENMATEEQFRSVLTGLVARGRLEEDDYSIILITISNDGN